MPSLRTAPGGDVYTAEMQLSDLVYGPSDVPPPAPAGAAPLVEPGTPPPPTQTYEYPTAPQSSTAPMGNSATPAGYGQPVADVFGSPAPAQPAAQPLNQAAAEPDYAANNQYAIHAGSDSNTLRSQSAYSPAPLATVNDPRAGNLPEFGGGPAAGLGVFDPRDATQRPGNIVQGAADAGRGFDEMSREFFRSPEGRAFGDMVMGIAGPGGMVRGAAPKRLPIVDDMFRVRGPRTASPAVRPGYAPQGPPPASPPPRPAPRVTGAPGSPPMPPRPRVVFPESPEPAPLPEPPPATEPPPRVSTRASAEAAGQAGYDALMGGTLGQRIGASWGRPSRYTPPNGNPSAAPGPVGGATGARRAGLGGYGARLAALGAAGGVGGVFLDRSGLVDAPTDVGPIFGPGNSRPGDGMTFGEPRPDAAREPTTIAPAETGLILNADGRVQPASPRLLELAESDGRPEELTQPFVSVLALDDAGQIVLTNPALVTKSALAGATERGEEPWRLSEAEMDHLIASGLILDADGVPLADPAEIANWKSLLVGANIMAPAEWVAALKGSGVEFTPIEQPAAPGAAVAQDAGGSGGGGYSSRRSSGGGGYSRRSYGGGGGGYRGGGGGGGGFPGFAPGDDAASFLGPDFMSGFMDGFAFPEAMAAASGSRRSRFGRRRGMPTRRTRTRRGARAVASPGKAEATPRMPGQDEEPQKATVKSKRKKKGD